MNTTRPFRLLMLFSGLLSITCCLLCFRYPLPIAGPFLAMALWLFGVSTNIAIRPAGKLRKITHGGRIRRILRSTFISPFRHALHAARKGSLLLTGLAALLVIFFSLRNVTWTLAAHEEAAASYTFLAITLFVSAFGARFIEFYHGLAKTGSPAQGAERPLEALLPPALARFLFYFWFIQAGLLLVEVYTALPLHLLVALLISGLVFFWIAETLFRSFLRLYQPPRIWRQGAPLGTLLPIRWCSNAGKSLFANGSSQGDDGDAAAPFRLSEMWFLPGLKKAVVPLSACVACVLWISSTLHIVPAGHAGLRLTLGALDDAELSPGLHLSLPFPFGSIHKVDTQGIRLVTLGLQSDTGEAILWDRQHYIGEVNQLVGQGEEFLTISVPIYYRVRDARAAWKTVRNPDEAVRQFAYQTLLHHTLNQTAFDIMTINRSALQDALHESLQASLDAHTTGLEVVMVRLRDIHPPVEVAPSYQEVVSAEEDREAFIHAGETYRAERLPRAHSDAAVLLARTDAAYEVRLQQASGEANAFDALLASYRLAPELYEYRRTFDAIDESLVGAKKLIIDEKFRTALPAYVDLRKVLNPELANDPVITPQFLIPNVGGKASAFDQLIEGYETLNGSAAPIQNAGDYLLEE